MEFSYYLRVILALLFVISLMGVVFLIFRRYSGYRLPSFIGKERLTIEEIKMIDAGRKLILVKNGEREYLILLGLQQDLLIDAYANDNLHVRQEHIHKEPEYETT